MSRSVNAKATPGSVRPRSRTNLTTLELAKDLKRRYKLDADRLGTTIRERTAQALRDAVVGIEKLTGVGR